MSRPLSFEIEGSCFNGQVMVVTSWPNFECKDLPESKTVTIEKVIEKPYPVYTEVPKPVIPQIPAKAVVGVVGSLLIVALIAGFVGGRINSWLENQ